MIGGGIGAVPTVLYFTRRSFVLQHEQQLQQQQHGSQHRRQQMQAS